MNHQGESAVAPAIPAGLLSDFLAVRKAKRAGALTKTAIAGIQREADKAGLSLEAAITACCEFGWQGFNARWYAERIADSPSSSNSHKHAAANATIAKVEKKSASLCVLANASHDRLHHWTLGLQGSS